MESSKENLSKEEKKALKSKIRADKEKIEHNIVSNNYTDTVTILCVRFGTLYGRQYVERLRNMKGAIQT